MSLRTIIQHAARVIPALTLVLLLWPVTVVAHGGGTPRLTNAEAGPYRVYAWTEPEPWRAGEAHLSLAVTVPNEEATNEPGSQVEIPVTDAGIRVTYVPRGEIENTAAPITVDATPQTLLGDFYFEADTVLPTAGLWEIEIAIDGTQGSGSTQFQLEALPARTTNWTLVAIAGGVLLVLIALIGVWSRIQQPKPAAQQPRPGTRRRKQVGKAAKVGEE